MPPTAFSFGELSGRAAISNPPVSNASQFVMATAFTGSFTTLTLRELNPSIAETRIYAACDLQGAQGLFSFAADGSDPIRVTTSPSGHADDFPSVAGNGKLVFEREGGIIPQITLANVDGSGQTPEVLGYQPSFDYAGDKFAYILSDGLTVDVFTIAAVTKTAVLLPTHDSVSAIALSPDGKTLYAALKNGSDFFIAKAPADGSATGTVLFDNGSGTASPIAVSPDGTQLVYCHGGDELDLLGTVGGEQNGPLNLPANVSGVSFSPDGKKIVFSMPYPTFPGLWFGLFNANVLVSISTPTSTTTTPCWAPFIKDKTLISGGGGLLGTHACGVIYGQTPQGPTTSVLAFDATTPSSVVMTAQKVAPGSNANLVFSIDADNITKLAYANAFEWRGIRAIGSGTPVLSANGALVSFGGTTGQIVSVLPFNGTRAAGSRPTITDSGSIRTFAGSFLAVYDKDGKNIAPSGASVIRLDMTTNKLVVTK